MATIDIGKLAFTHKGDYDGSTAYVARDVVYYNGSAYIAKTSTTGNLPTSTAHWSTFASGSGGIWNSGLSIGSAGQVVKVNSGASALEFGTISSDYVKIAEQSSNNLNATSFQFNNCFDDSTYKSYELIVRYNQQGTTAARLIARFLDASNNELGSSGNNYFRAGYQAYVNSGTNTSGTWNSYGRNDFDIFNWSNDQTDAVFNMAHWQIGGRLNSTTHYPTMLGQNTGKDDSGTHWYFSSFGGFTFEDLTDIRGIKFFSSDSENIEHIECQLYGRK